MASSFVNNSRSSEQPEFELDQIPAVYTDTSNLHGESRRPSLDSQRYNNSSSRRSESPYGLSSQHSANQEVSISELPPVDGGFDAYAYLAAAFVVELLVWSPPFSYGVFLEYYRSTLFPDDKSALLPLIGSISSGLIYLLSLVLIPVFTRWPNQKQNSMYVGTVLCVIGLLSASFAKTPSQLVITQGVIFSCGGAALYFSASTFVWEWFVVHRGMANGLIFSGTGLGGLFMPLVLNWILKKWGHETTLRVLAIIFAVFIPPVLPFIKSRYPKSQVVGTRRVNWSFVRNPAFWMFTAANTLQGLGIFIPSIYIPTFASDLGLTTNSGTLCLSLMNAAACFGTILLGWLSDKHLVLGILLSGIGSSLSAFFVWGFSLSLAPLLTFSIIFGFLGPSWSAMWPRFISAVSVDPTETLILYAIFVSTRGLGNILSAPISTGLLTAGQKGFASAKGAYGLSDYAPLILFTGATMMVSSFGACYAFFPKPDKSETIEISVRTGELDEDRRGV
ncbi:Monocarboxylate transporter [Phaffia rhodozyma]|uniref:Monocarboxylate transporter n=1 Tax=Phaffia rhodozyma TaxID=264483 RepID=A0A0F7SIG5_PHARH|nr:Monocarboxylate transporter [Phaffia rhodozyma]